MSTATAIDGRREIEKRFWASDDHERPGADPLINILNKVGEARVFHEKLNLHRDLFASSGTILELGGGQLWASSLVKRRFPDALVIGTDLSEDAIASHRLWAKIFGAAPDRALACPAEQIPIETGSVDLVFAFAAAHHFGRFRATLTEISRILSADGHAIFLHEPVCQSFIYPLAHARANAKRPAVPEDVIVYRKLASIGRDLGLTVDTRFAPTLTDRRGASAVYYFGINKAPWLQHLLPTSADIVIRRRC
jgi:SAM-dependent methyltransferase